jgi:hypothetical protein
MANCGHWSRQGPSSASTFFHEGSGPFVPCGPSEIAYRAVTGAQVINVERMAVRCDAPCSPTPMRASPPTIRVSRSGPGGWMISPGSRAHHCRDRLGVREPHLCAGADRRWGAIPIAWPRRQHCKRMASRPWRRSSWSRPRRQGFVWTSPRGSEHARDEVHRIITRNRRRCVRIFEDHAPARFRLTRRIRAILDRINGSGDCADGTRRLLTTADRGGLLDSIDDIPQPMPFTARVGDGEEHLPSSRSGCDRIIGDAAAPHRRPKNPRAKWCSYSAARKSVFRARDVD